MTTLPQKPLTWEKVAEACGAFVAGVLLSAAGILITAYLIHWILTWCGIAQLTYLQVIGAVSIWEIIKPRSSK